MDNVFLEQNYYNKQIFNKTKNVEKVFFDGQIYDSYSEILGIFESAASSLIVIDNNVDESFFDIICKLEISVILITSKDCLISKQQIREYNRHYNNLRVIYNETFGDNFYIVDNRYIYRCGTSINKELGYGVFCLVLLCDPNVCMSLIDVVKSIIFRK